MTAGLTPGDAISNNIMSVRRILRRWGVKVRIFADSIAPEFGAIAEPSRFYQNSGQDILWFHYSIYSDNVEIALASNDFKIMNYHGICPPRLFKGQNAHLEFLCQRGIELCPSLHDKFDAYVVHSEYTRNELQNLGFQSDKIYKIPLCVDTSDFMDNADLELSHLLSQLTYFLLVGRIVPQKDVIALVEIFARINQQRPETVLILVGTRQHANKYQQQLDNLIAAKGLTDRVIFTEQVNNPAVLSALYENAKLLFVTSEWESFCVPIAESLFFKVPVVVHDAPPMPEVAGPAGLVIDKNEVETATNTVLALLEDEPRYLELGRMAGEWAQQYTDTALQHNMLKLFSEIFEIALE